MRPKCFASCFCIVAGEQQHNAQRAQSQEGAKGVYGTSRKLKYVRQAN